MSIGVVVIDDQRVRGLGVEFGLANDPGRIGSIRRDCDVDGAAWLIGEEPADVMIVGCGLYSTCGERGLHDIKSAGRNYGGHSAPKIILHGGVEELGGRDPEVVHAKSVAEGYVDATHESLVLRRSIEDVCSGYSVFEGPAR